MYQGANKTQLARIFLGMHACTVMMWRGHGQSSDAWTGWPYTTSVHACMQWMYCSCVLRTCMFTLRGIQVI